jgi:hypothetical protein
MHRFVWNLTWSSSGEPGMDTFSSSKFIEKFPLVEFGAAAGIEDIDVDWNAPSCLQAPLF